MGDVFVDAGNAWGPELGVPGFQNPRGSWLASAGAEVRLRFTPFWSSGLDLRAGLAFPLVEGDGPGFYLRLGPSF
jgi:outer membrane protein assembly factor BamA